MQQTEPRTDSPQEKQRTTSTSKSPWYLHYPLRRGQSYTDDGCILEVIEGIRCKTPKIPAKEKIAGINLPVKSQKFRPTLTPHYMEDEKMEYDEIGNLILSTEQELFTNRENRRNCDFGYWVMIKGCITWIYGTHYFELNYWPIDAETENRKKEYRARDRQFWMVWWAIKNEPRIVGLLNLKHRRAGATFAAFAEAVVECMKREHAAISFFNFNKDTNKERFDLMFKPAAIACKKWVIGINNLDDKSTKFECKSPVKRKSVENAKGFDVAGTKSVITLQATTEKGADGAKNHFQFWDEFFKLEDIDFAKAIEAQIPVVTLGAGIKKVGSIMCLSTTEEIKAGNTAHNKWVQSKKYYYDTDGNLTSPTQFISIFFSAAYCLEGFVDDYGDAIDEDPDEETRKWMIANPKKCPLVMGSKRYLKETKATLLAVTGAGAMEAYLSFCRKHPESEEEAFMGASGNNSFHREILINTLQIVRSNNGITGVKSKIRKGNFEWIDPSNKQKGCFWKDDNRNGRTQTTMLFNDPDKMANRMVRGMGGLPSPLHIDKGSVSVDPYSKDKTPVDEKRCSLGAAHTILYFEELNERTRWDVSGKSIDGMQRNDYHPTPSIITSYNYRPDDVTVFHDDNLKTCIYYGLPCALEANVGQVEKHFSDNGFENYLLGRHLFTDNPGGSDYKAKGMIMNEHNASLGYNLIDRFVKGQMPWLNGYTYKLDTELEALRAPFEALLIQLLAFNFQKRSPYDMVMSLMPGLIYMEQLFKHKGTIFDNHLSLNLPAISSVESDMLSGLSYGMEGRRPNNRAAAQLRYLAESE